jgi:hypothetical protein
MNNRIENNVFWTVSKQLSHCILNELYAKYFHVSVYLEPDKVSDIFLWICNLVSSEIHIWLIITK